MHYIHYICMLCPTVGSKDTGLVIVVTCSEQCTVVMLCVCMLSFKDKLLMMSFLSEYNNMHALFISCQTLLTLESSSNLRARLPQLCFVGYLKDCLELYNSMSAHTALRSFSQQHAHKCAVSAPGGL